MDTIAKAGRKRLSEQKVVDFICGRSGIKEVRILEVLECIGQLIEREIECDKHQISVDIPHIGRLKISTVAPRIISNPVIGSMGIPAHRKMVLEGTDRIKAKLKAPIMTLEMLNDGSE
jgi:hypothetical protein